MCDRATAEQWRGIGITSYSGQYTVLEQCLECGEYRARAIDLETLPVVEGEPSYERHEDIVTTETDSDDDIIRK